MGLINKITTGDKIWATSIILYVLWVLIAYDLNININKIAIIGSIGMIVFVIIGCLISLLYQKIKSKKWGRKIYYRRS